MKPTTYKSVVHAFALIGIGIGIDQMLTGRWGPTIFFLKWLLAPTVIALLLIRILRPQWYKALPILIVVLSITITSTVAVPYLYQTRGGTSHYAVGLMVPQAQAQEEVGGLWLLLEELYPIIEKILTVYGIYQVFSDVASEITSIWGSSRPEIGVGSATDDTARLLGMSSNGFAKDLGVIFAAIESPYGGGCSISQCSKVYTARAWTFCKDLENKCGFTLGYTLCTQYLYVASMKNANSNGLALYNLYLLDTRYPQCH